MKPSLPVSISISISITTNSPRFSHGLIILREISPVRARRETERRIRIKKRREGRIEKSEEARGKGNEKSGKREIVVGYSPRMPSWLLLFLDLRTDAPRMSWSPLLYGPAWGPHSIPRPITYEMRRSYCKSLFLSLFLSCLFLRYRVVRICSNLSLYFQLKFIHSIRIGIGCVHSWHTCANSMTNEREKWTILYHEDRKNLFNCFDIIRVTHNNITILLTKKSFNDMIFIILLIQLRHSY